MAYFDTIYAINDIFDQVYVHKPVWNNFYKHLEINLADIFPKISTYAVIFTPKIEGIWDIFRKMTYFDQIDPINDYFDQIYVHKPDWNNF